MEELQVYNIFRPKIRIGARFDGGYVIAQLPGAYDGLIGCGIGNNAEFEFTFLRLHENVRAVLYDATIDKLPGSAPEKVQQRIEFVRKNVSYPASAHVTDLSEALASKNDVLLKMDIEGHEFRALPSLIASGLIRKVKQLVVEIHSPADIVLHPRYYVGLENFKTAEYMLDMLRGLSRTHTLIHLHPNNGTGTHLVHGTRLPNVFECTFVRNDQFERREPLRVTLPTRIDAPNLPHMGIEKFYFLHDCSA